MVFVVMREEQSLHRPLRDKLQNRSTLIGGAAIDQGRSYAIDDESGVDAQLEPTNSEAFNGAPSIPLSNAPTRKPLP